MADNLQIHVQSFKPGVTQEQALADLVDAMADVLDERQLRHITNAVLLRESTQTTYLDQGLAIPHGRTTALDSIYISAGFSREGIPWPNETQRAHLIIMIGVPTAMVTGYLTTMQQLLRWHKTATLEPSGSWSGDDAALLAALQQAMK